MRNKILGGIAVLWGGAVLAMHFMKPAAATGNAAYDSGAKGGLIFGAVILLVGVVTLVKEMSRKAD